jgi:UDP-N-acetylglucosamine acyltransferase
MPRVHPTAVVDPRAELADDVEIGAYAVVEGGVRLGRATRLMAHAVIHGPCAMGEGNVVHPFAVIGGAPQAKKHGGGATRTEIGDHNVLREHVTIHGGTEGRATRIGSHNLLMVGAHVAHDVVLGSRCVVANAVQLAGHAVVEDWVTFGGLAGVAQFGRVGESAFVAAGAMCEQRVPPFVIVQGDRARVRALNVVGLRRRGVSDESIAALERAFRVLFSRKRTRAEALRAVDRSDPFVARLASALEERA